MQADLKIASEKKESIHALEATNFFLADVQPGLGSFLAAYLAGAGWGPGRVGIALTVASSRLYCRRQRVQSSTTCDQRG